MSQPMVDLKSLTVQERLRLIDELWLSIAEDAERGDELAMQALDLDRPLDPEVIAELERRADELEKDPSKGVRWEDLRDELRRKYE
jgi:putative addiction module component (TIGR02574 family)